MSQKPPFRVLEAVDQQRRKDEAERFLRQPATQMILGRALKMGAAFERAELTRRRKERSNPSLFPEMVVAEEQRDQKMEEKLDSQAAQGERLIEAGKRRLSFKAS